jgi:phosphate-selective porin OprO/OprP
MHSLRSNRLSLTAAVTAVLLPAIVQADPATDELLLQKIEELSQKVLVLERKLEVQDEATKAAVASTPVVKASPKGFSLASADGQNQIKLRGTVHIDGRFFQNEDPEGLKDTWQATRVRPIVEGTLGGIYDFKIMPDFGQGRTVIQDAYVTARFKPAFQVTAGKFKSPVGLERLQSANARASRRSSITTSAASGCSANTPPCRRTSRAPRPPGGAKARWTRRPGSFRRPGS